VFVINDKISFAQLGFGNDSGRYFSAHFPFAAWYIMRAAINSAELTIWQQLRPTVRAVQLAS
jgi:hypothetical protein